MKKFAALIIYGSALAIGIAASYVLSVHLLAYFSAPVLGSFLVALFAALYIGELKQESIGQLYQSLAVANFKSADQADFNSGALDQIRTVRRIFLLSNLIKFLGAGAGLYLTSEKNPLFPFEHALLVGFFCSVCACILFLRLWVEVSATESLLIQLKTEAMVAERRKQFLEEGKNHPSYDFANDSVIKSFEVEAQSTNWQEAK